MGLTLTTGAAAMATTVEFVVEVPSDTPAAASVHVAGGLAELGGWRGDGLVLKRSKDGKYRGKFDAPDDTSIEFKFTLGSWATVEKNADGGEIANRRIFAKKGMESGRSFEFHVARWASTDLTKNDAAHSDAAGSGDGRRTAAKSTRTGDIRLHEHFKSTSRKTERSIIVYLPPGYEADKSARYPVLYMHDGQNLFDAATSFIGVEWQADETAERLIKAKKIEPLIIVGIYNTADRKDEYTPTRDSEWGAGGRGGAYMEFVVKEVKPFIDKSYRTKPGREATGVAGSSLGGLISLHLGIEYPEVFSRIGVISPALYWDDHFALRETEKKGDALSHARIWLDIGTKEGSTLPQFNRAVDDARRLAEILKGKGFVEGKNLRYLEVAGAVHNEGAWSERFGEILTFLYGVNGSDTSK